MWTRSPRRLAKTGLACALRCTGFDRLIGAMNGSRRQALVVGYHGVVEDFRAHLDTAIPAILTSRLTLERHLDWIGRRRRFVSLDELGRRLENGGGFEEPVAAVTFDDGYANVYDHAFPFLKRKGIPAGVFVVTDLVGGSRPNLHDHLYLLLAQAFKVRHWTPRDLGRLLGDLELRRPETAVGEAPGADPLTAMQALLADLPQEGVRRIISALEAEVEVGERVLEEVRPVTWEMLDEMRRAGVTIGSHTRSHGLLTNESPARVLNEIAGSRRELERRLGTAPVHFAYPGGRFDEAAVRAVRESGFRYGYTTCAHRDPANPLLTIPRKLLWERACLDVFGRFSPAIMGCQVNGVFDLLTGCGMDHGARWSAA
ncbi:MAG TPA: polysaccharide deacetylase family protein [Candidatus Polarisedimenticolia bacterium]|nr:polysaccharide deacetylase family protein [Candidatus Polarisedimenticolia bacterium]